MCNLSCSAVIIECDQYNNNFTVPTITLCNATLYHISHYIYSDIMASVYVICIGDVIFTSEIIRRNFHFLTPSVTLDGISLL